MKNSFTKITVKNFRCIADLSVEVGPINILFGPNASGKSTFLDVFLFVRDIALHGLEWIAKDRNYGANILWAGANKSEPISFRVETEESWYELTLGTSLDDIVPFPGEVLYSIQRHFSCMSRAPGNEVAWYGSALRHTPQESISVITQGAESILAVARNIANLPEEVAAFRKLLESTGTCNSRAFLIKPLKQKGSYTNMGTTLSDGILDLWSVLRNLHGWESRDDRYQTIIDFMKQGFPKFEALWFDQREDQCVYGSFVEKGFPPVRASGVSDGELQLLILLTKLFCQEKESRAVIMFDEPELALHPHALAVFATAVKIAAQDWNRQIFISTHSPVLLSQFEPHTMLITTLDSKGMTLQQVKQLSEVKNLFKEDAVGMLYIAQQLVTLPKVVA